jgi:hypothetical protein
METSHGSIDGPAAHGAQAWIRRDAPAGWVLTRKTSGKAFSQVASRD